MRDASLQQLHMFLAEGVASQTTGCRPGARHALMLFAVGSDMPLAQSAALTGAEGAGWSLLEIKKRTPIASGPIAIADPNLSNAAESAVAEGFGMVVYTTELTSDA
ncbi:MAG: hypothetical protein AAF577_04420 [Pseudomonadota bacterium]